jgi:hypothetical protein
VQQRPSPVAGLRVTAFPNPFNPATTILIDLPDRAVVDAVIYDPRGRVARHLFNRELPAGISHLSWDGTNDQGQRLASGVYFLKLAAPSAVKTLKLVLIK